MMILVHFTDKPAYFYCRFLCFAFRIACLSQAVPFMPPVYHHQVQSRPMLQSTGQSNTYQPQQQQQYLTAQPGQFTIAVPQHPFQQVTISHQQQAQQQQQRLFRFIVPSIIPPGGMVEVVAPDGNVLQVLGRG